MDCTGAVVVMPLLTTHLLEHVLGHGGLFERHHGLGDAISLDGDIHRSTPLVSLVIGAAGYVRVLDVEVFLELGQPGTSMLYRSLQYTTIISKYSGQQWT